jgi:hypothetical protein
VAASIVPFRQQRNGKRCALFSSGIREDTTMNKPRDLTGHEKEDLPRDHQQNKGAGKTGQKPAPEPGKHPPAETPDRTQPKA